MTSLNKNTMKIMKTIPPPANNPPSGIEWGLVHCVVSAAVVLSTVHATVLLSLYAHPALIHTFVALRLFPSVCAVGNRAPTIENMTINPTIAANIFCFNFIGFVVSMKKS